MRKNHPYPARPFLIKHQASFVQELKYVSAVFQHYVVNLGEYMFLADLQINVFLIINYIGRIQQIAKVNNVHFESGGFPSPWSVFASMLVTLCNI